MTSTHPMRPAADGRAPSRADLAVFVPADPPRTGHLLLTGDVLTDLGTPGAADVVPPPGDGARNVPVRRVPVAEALAPLLAGPAFEQGESGAVALRFWADAARFAVHLVARGRLLPGVSPAGFDAWRVGPLDAGDADRLHALAAAMPPTARAVPEPGVEPPALPAAALLVRAFLDAVADVLPRSAEAVEEAGTPVYASPEPQAVAHLRDWADEVAAGVDAGVRLSLRIEVEPDATRFRAVVQLHALDDPTRVADLAAVWSGAAVGFGPRARIDALLAVRRAARFWDPLHQLLGQAVPDVLDLDDGDVTDLLGDGAARLAAAGIAVHWPRELRPELASQAVAGRGSGPTPFTAGGEPLHLDWELALRGDPLTGEEMAELAAGHRPVVRLRDEWVLVDPTTRARAADRTLGPVNPVTALGAALTGRVDDRGTPVLVLTTGWLQELTERIAAPPAPLEPPAGLAATLRDYQLRGVGWLDRMTTLGLGACLADDMGLGKTITVIALHLHRSADRSAGPTLVVCPASLLGNWEREITRFAPGVPVDRYHGSGRALPGHDGFVLTTYATMRLDVDALAGHRWGLVVADEAQHVKNPASGTALALRRIPSAARVALTGTPVENDLVELWSILDWTTPGLLGGLSEFRARWADPIAEDRDVAERFGRLIAPFLLRRRKSDPGIAPELPRKTETDRPVGLTREQAGLYEAVVAETMERIARADGMARRGLVLALLTALKQICDHPALYAKEPDPVLAGRSGKLELLDELLDTILAEDGAALVFTQYVAMGRLLERHLRARGTSVQFLHGGTPVPEREAMVERFQRGEAAVFLLSLRAAGTGLNLTRADHVVHFDRWWNPAVEEQATDRAYRIGQTRPVQVHRLISEGTVEDRIAALLESKRALADAVLAGGESALTELTDAQLADLVALRGDA